jgi:hypothetical protein
MPRQPFVLVGAMWRETIGEFASDYHVRPQFRKLIRYADGVEQVPDLLKK